MKKKIAVLAGVLLVSGTVFGESKLDISGSSVMFKQLIKNSETGNQMYQDSDWGTVAKLKLQYQIDSSNQVSIEYLTDESDKKDDAAKVLLKRTDGPLEAQVATELNFGKDSEGFKEVPVTKDTYIKYNMENGYAVTVYPLDMGTNTGGWFGDSDNSTQIPGVVLSKGNFLVGLGVDQIGWPMKSGVTEKENVVALKTEYGKSIGGVWIKAQYSGVFYDSDKLTVANNNDSNNKLGTKNEAKLGIVNQQANVSLYKKMDSGLILQAEGGINILEKNALKLGDEYINQGVAGMFRVAYEKGKVTPYAQTKYITDGFLNYWRQDDKNTPTDNKYNDGKKTGGTTEFVLGADYKIMNNFVFNVEGQYVQAGEKIFYDSTLSGANKEKNYYEVSSSVVYKF